MTLSLRETARRRGDGEAHTRQIRPSSASVFGTKKKMARTPTAKTIRAHRDTITWAVSRVVAVAYRVDSGSLFIFPPIQQKKRLSRTRLGVGGRQRASYLRPVGRIPTWAVPGGVIAPR